MAAAAREKEERERELAEEEAQRATTDQGSFTSRHRYRTPSSESGGWRSGTGDDEDDGVSDNEGWRQPAAESTEPPKEEWLGDSLKKATSSTSLPSPTLRLSAAPAGHGGKIVVSPPAQDGDSENEFPLPRSRSNTTRSKSVSQEPSRSASPPPPIPLISPSKRETVDSTLGGPVVNEPESSEPPAASGHRRSIHSVDMKIPGSFHWSDSDLKPGRANMSEPQQQLASGWGQLFKKFSLNPS
jgi:hypothetical protein